MRNANDFACIILFARARCIDNVTLCRLVGLLSRGNNRNGCDCTRHSPAISKTRNPYAVCIVPRRSPVSAVQFHHGDAVYQHRDDTRVARVDFMVSLELHRTLRGGRPPLRAVSLRSSFQFRAVSIRTRPASSRAPSKPRVLARLDGTPARNDRGSFTSCNEHMDVVASSRSRGRLLPRVAKGARRMLESL